MNDAVILNCTCKHEWQDETYGKGRRVFITRKEKAPRCTVCGTENKAYVPKVAKAVKKK